MARKRIGKGEPGAEEAEAEAREIGRLQKRARERDRLAPSPPRPRDDKPRRLFSGGAKESSEEETLDEPFRAADMLRSLSPVVDEGGDVARYKRGPKKGQPKFKPRGSLRARNEAKLRQYIGKEIRIVVKFDKLSAGKVEYRHMRRARKLVYHSYDGLVAAYQDVMRQTINEESEAGYYVETVDFDTPPEPRRKKGKSKRAKRAKKGNAAAHSTSVRRKAKRPKR